MFHALLRRLHAEVLVVSADLLDAGVEDDKVVGDLQKPVLPAELAQLPEQRAVSRVRIGPSFLPAQPMLLRGLDNGVAQPLGVVAGHQELHRGEERLDELLLLAVEVLADSLGHRHGGAFQLQHPQGDPVDVENDVGPPCVFSEDGDFLGNAEVVVGGVIPVEQRHGDELLAHGGLHLHAVAQQAVDFAVGLVERLAAAERPGLFQLEQGLVDGLVAVTLAPQPAGEVTLLDVAVAAPVLPVPEVGVA